MQQSITRLERVSSSPFFAPSHPAGWRRTGGRSEEHTSELQSLAYLVCRLLLEKKKNTSEVQSLTYLVYRLLLRRRDHRTAAPREARDRTSASRYRARSWVRVRNEPRPYPMPRR